jgi:hypothetical protein
VTISLSDPGPITIVEGHNESITCQSDCSPPCNYTWSRTSDSSWSHTGSLLEFVNIDRNEHDTYTCNAENGYESDMSTSLDIIVHCECFMIQSIAIESRYICDIYYVCVIWSDPPDPPSNLRCVDVTAVSLYLEWTAGYHGGPGQTFIITYTDLNTGSSQTIEIPADWASEGDIVRYKLTDKQYVLPERTYSVQVNSENIFGITFGPRTINTTLGTKLVLHEYNLFIYDILLNIHNC